MAKSQKRSGREPKKPKQTKLKVSPPATALSSIQPKPTAAVSDRKIDGFGELMRLKGMEKTRFAHLSRGGAFTRGQVLIVNVPGSPKGAVESLEAVAELIPHVVDLLNGRTKHRA